MGVAYFGLIVHLNAEKALMFFTMLIIGLILFDKLLERVEHSAHDAKFGALIDKIYKEMMTMGFIGFIIFITFNVFTLEHDEKFLAFEFVHITIFCMAIVVVFRAFFVIYVSTRSIKGFWRAQTQDCSLILDRYKTTLEEFTLESFLFNHFPIFSNLYRDIEYKLMEDYFYEDFKISRHEFRFLDYLSMSNKLYAIEMLETSPLSWAVVCFLVVLNYFRISLHFHCHVDDHRDDDNHDDDNHRLLEEGDDGAELVISEHCAEYTTDYFLLCGFLLVVFGLLVSALTWRSKVHLMEIAAGDDKSNYEVILEQVMQREKLSEKLIAREHAKLEKENSFVGDEEMDVDIFADDEGEPESNPTEDNAWHVISLRQVINEQKKKEEEYHLKARHRWIERFDICGIYVKLSSVFGDAQVHDINFEKMEELLAKRKLYYHGINSKLPRGESCSGFSVHHILHGESIREEGEEEGGGGEGRGGGGRGSPSRSLRTGAMMASFQSNRPDSIGSEAPSFLLLRQTSMKNPKVASLITQRSLTIGGGAGAGLGISFGAAVDKETIYSEETSIHPLMFELDQVFLFQSRFLYKFLIEIYQMLNALYVSLWLTNFAFIALESHHAVVYNVFIVTSIGVMFYMLSFIQFHATCLLAVTSLRNEATEWICEQDMMKSDILPRLRDKMLNVIDVRHFVQEIEMIFDLIKDPAKDGIGIKEFKNLLQTLNLHFSKDEISCLFRVMNTNGNGLIDLTELKELLQEKSSLISKETEKDTKKETSVAPRKKEREKRRSGTLHVARLSSSLTSFGYDGYGGMDLGDEEFSVEKGNHYEVELQ